MTNYYKLHAEQFAKLVAAFQSHTEIDGTPLLEHSLLLWIPELANGWHDLYKMMIVMAGSAGGSFKTGRYLKYKETSSPPVNGYDDLILGPRTASCSSRSCRRSASIRIPSGSLRPRQSTARPSTSPARSPI